MLIQTQATAEALQRMHLTVDEARAAGIFGAIKRGISKAVGAVKGLFRRKKKKKKQKAKGKPGKPGKPGKKGKKIDPRPKSKFGEAVAVAICVPDC